MFFTINLAQDQSKLSPYISNTLIQSIEETLEKWEKCLLYLNKRGVYSSLICEDCQHLFECPNCDVSLHVHHNPKHLKCHICQHSFRIPLNCPHCHGNTLKNIGVGTQQIEEKITSKFPESKIYRFDSDSMKNSSSKKLALSQLTQADIIIGTKMITTGFDFEKIGLIAILLAEWELSSPSYDAYEQAYSNLRQLIGRGNRKSQKTTIILQTFIPKNPLITALCSSNYKDFLTLWLRERKEFCYPPYSEMITLEYRHKDPWKSETYIQQLTWQLREIPASQKIQFLPSSKSFRKNKMYYSKLILKGEDIRILLSHIQSTILANPHLSVIFHE